VLKSSFWHSKVFFKKPPQWKKTNFESWESWDIICKRRANCSLGAKDATHCTLVYLCRA